MATPTKKPSGAVKSLAVQRGKNGSRKFTASWKVPGELVKDSASDHATKIVVTWLLGIPGKDPKHVEVIKKTSVKSDEENLNNFDAGKKTYTRDSFYPVHPSRKLSYVTVKARAANKVGSSSKCPATTYAFKTPRKPVISDFALATETATISVTITTDPGNDSYERYDTEYYWKVVNTATNQTLVDTHTASTGTTINLSYDAEGYQLLGTGYIVASVRARSRGYAGASAWTATKRYYLAFPNAPTIKGVSAPSDASTDRVTVLVDTGATTQHPVTQVRLQALVDVEYSTVDEVLAASDQWDDVGGVDDGECTALTALVSDVRPTTAGRHSWVRVQSWYAIDNVLVAYSMPVEVTDLYRPAYTATGDTVTILDGMPGDDGESAVMLLGWAPVGETDESDGTELTWSDQLDTWMSTEDPNLYELTRDDGPVTVGGTTYQSSATIIIKGLEEGATTYVRARRYAESDSGITYGEYSNTWMVTPAVIPESVVLDAPAYVAEGEGISCTWIFGGTSPQVAWMLTLSDGTVLASGEDALGSCIVSAERAASMATNGALTISVSVSTGGTWVTSDALTVRIVERPTLALSVPATLTAQPLTLGATCATVGATMSVRVTAQGTSGDTPTGVSTQAEGDIVWSGVLAPQFGAQAATVTLPDALPFVDGAYYDVTASVTDPSTGLTSEAQTGELLVDWAHQAPDPDGCATLTAIDTIDADGVSTKAVQIDLVPPTGSASSDCYDIYRVTNDGAQLIGETYPLTVTVTDQFAPYGTGMTHRYRIACRTADGDVEWYDATYEMGGGAIRIDWADRYVELPYDIAITDGYAHDVDVHEYLDGSTDAFYNAGTKRTAKLSTDVLRLRDPDTIEAVQALAHHVGSAFVRTPSGAAYEAAVSVDSIVPSYELAAVTISATEVDLTPAYMLPPYNVEDETEE